MIPWIRRKLEQKVHKIRARVDEFEGEPDVGRKQGYKFLADFDLHYRRIVSLVRASRIRAGERILDLGPGCGYLMWMVKLAGCEVVGLEHPRSRSEVYRICREVLGIQNDVMFGRVEPQKLIPVDGRFDLIIGTATVFDIGWGLENHQYFVEDAMNHLKDGGRLCLSFNAQTANNEEVMGWYLNVGYLRGSHFVTVRKPS